MSVRRNVAANFLGQAWTTIVGIAFIPVYLRFLGLEGYGLIGVFALLQTWLSLLDLGLSPAIGREMARATGGAHDAASIRALLRSVELVAILIGLLTAVTIWLLSDWLSTHWLNTERLDVAVVMQALSLMGLVVGLRFIEGIYRSAVIGLQIQVAQNALTGALATVRAGGAVVVLALVSPTVTAFFAWQAIMSVVSLAAIGALLYRALPPSNMRPRVSLEPLRAVWRFAAGSLLITALGFAMSQSDKVILSSALTLSAFGLYSVASTVASTVRLLSQPIDQAVFPRMTELFQIGDEAGLKSIYHRASQLNAVLVGGVTVFLGLFGREVLLFWTGDDSLADAAYPLLAILGVGTGLNAFLNAPYYLQMAAGWTGLLVRLNAALVVVFVPLVYLLTLQYQALGAAVAWVGLNVVYLLVLVRLMHRRLLRGEMSTWYVQDLFAPVGAALALGLVLRASLPVGIEGWQAVLALALTLAGILTAAAMGARHVRSELRARVKLAIGRAT